MDAFGNFDEGGDDFVLQQPVAQPMQEQNMDSVQFPVAQEQFGQSMGGMGSPMMQNEDDDLTEEEKALVAKVREDQQ